MDSVEPSPPSEAIQGSEKGIVVARHMSSTEIEAFKVGRKAIWIL